MLQPLCISGAYGWSRSLPNAQAIANAYLFVDGDAGAVVNPLPLDEQERDRLDRLGGVARIILTIGDRRAAAEEIAHRYGAAIVDRAEHRQELFNGAFAVRLLDQRNDNDFAVSLPKLRTVIVGESILGVPAGALSMPPENEFPDVRKAALALRRILRENPERILPGFGQPVYADAYDALYRLLYARAGAEVHRINLTDLDFRDERAEREAQPAVYHTLDAEVGFVIGARKLGYRVNTLAPGQRFCPLHSHAREEELFFILDGEPSIRTLSGTMRCRKGDFIAFPVGASGTHQLLNESDAPATVLLLGRLEEFEACYYPDSDKLLVDTPAPIEDGRTSMMVKGSPDLDYFHGEA